MSSSGPLYTTFAVVVLAVRLVGGRLADRRGRIVVALPGMGLCVVGMAVLALQPAPALAFVGVAGFGAGFSLLFPALMALTVDRVADAERGAAVGSFTAFFDIGSTTGSFAVGAVSDRYGFGGGYGLPAVLGLVGLGILIRLGRQVRAESEAMPPPWPNGMPPPWPNGMPPPWPNGMGDEAPLPEPPGA
jgi:MFS family permease